MLYIILILRTSGFQKCVRLNRRGISWAWPDKTLPAQAAHYSGHMYPKNVPPKMQSSANRGRYLHEFWVTVRICSALYSFHSFLWLTDFRKALYSFWHSHKTVTGKFITYSKHLLFRPLDLWQKSLFRSSTGTALEWCKRANCTVNFRCL